jgi:hypothetical protein
VGDRGNRKTVREQSSSRLEGCLRRERGRITHRRRHVRDQEAVRGKIDAPVPLMLRGLPEEDAPIKVRGEIVGSDYREV